MTQRALYYSRELQQFDTIYLDYCSILLRFFTFYDTANIAIRFCDTLQFISPIYYVSYTGSLCSHLGAVNLFSTLTSFLIPAVTQDKNKVLCHLVDLRSNVIIVNICTKIILKSQYEIKKYCDTWHPYIGTISCQKILRY